VDLFNKIAGAIGIITIVVGFVVLLVVYAKGSYGKARMEALREDNGDLRARRADDAVELSVKDAKIEALSSQLVSEKDKNEVMKELVLQAPNVAKLTEELRQHNDAGIVALKEHADKVVNALQEHDRRASLEWDRINQKFDALQEEVNAHEG
jgi:chromosome segregation ATPase